MVNLAQPFPQEQKNNFQKRSVTPSWEFVVAPAGYNFTP